MGLLNYQEGDERRLDKLADLDSKVVQRVLRVMRGVQAYFRYEARGLENIPASGGGLLVMPHSLLTIDGMMLGVEILERRGRRVRALGDHQLFTIPGVREILLAMGTVDGRRDSAIAMLKDGNLCMVMPGGAREAWQPVHRRHDIVWDGHYGFIKVALRAGVPIIPSVCIGAAEAYWAPVHTLKWGQRVFRRRMPLLPPFGIGLTPVPIPVKCTGYVGEPIDLGYGPDAADDPEVVQRLHGQVVDVVRGMQADGLRRRNSLFR